MTGAQFSVAISTDGIDRSTVVQVRGEVDLATAPQLFAAVSEALDGGRPTVLDLEGVGFIDASGVGALVLAAAAASDRGRELRISRASLAVRRVLDLTPVAPGLRPLADAS